MSAAPRNEIPKTPDTPTTRPRSSNLESPPMTQQFPPPPPSGPQQWPLPTAPAAKKPKQRRWPWIAGIVVAFLLGLGIGGSGDKTSTTTAAGSAPTTQTVTVVAPAPQQPAQQADVAAPPAASGALTSFSDGTYEVGGGDGQIAPGKYKSAGGGMCYWARLKHNDGAMGDIIANNVGEGQMILNVAKSDGYVEIRGCTFTKAS